MASRIRIFDHFCKLLVEIDAPTTPRSWILNGYGRCEFSVGYMKDIPIDIPYIPDKVLIQNFQYGNLIYIEHIPSVDESDNQNGKLLDWIGIILPPRSWDYGIMHVTAYSAESILAFRAMPFLKVSGTPKVIFSQILKYAHVKAKNIIIQPGQIDDLSLTFSDDLRTNAYDHIKKLIKDSNMDWSITGNVNNKNELELYANLYYQKGIDTGFYLSNTNTELSSPLLTEQGTPSNQVFGYSHAQTERGRFQTEVIDQSAMDDYGPLQLNQTYVGKHDPTSINNAAQSRIDKRSRPVKMIKRIALDYQNTFDYLNVGNTVIIKDISVGFNPNGGFGFESEVRILSMDYNDLSNKTSLNVEIVRDIVFNSFTGQNIAIVQDTMLWDDASIMIWDDNSEIIWDE